MRIGCTDLSERNQCYCPLVPVFVEGHLNLNIKKLTKPPFHGSFGRVFCLQVESQRKKVTCVSPKKNLKWPLIGGGVGSTKKKSAFVGTSKNLQKKKKSRQKSRQKKVADFRLCVLLMVLVFGLVHIFELKEATQCFDRFLKAHVAFFSRAHSSATVFFLVCLALVMRK